MVYILSLLPFISKRSSSSSNSSYSISVNIDEKWNWVRKQDLCIENKPLKNWLKKLKEKEENENKVVGKPPASHLFQGLIDLNTLAGGKNRDVEDKFDGKIPEENFMTEYTEETLVDILNQQNTLVELLWKNDKTKHLANRILFIFDDLVGSTLFGSARQNPFKMFNTNHRHYSASILMVSQAFKEVCNM